MKNIINELQEIRQLTLLGAKKVLTMKEAAFVLGLSISHLYKLTCYKKIPHYKSQGGKLIYFDKDELNNWMLQHRVKTTDELDTEAETFIVTGKKKRGKNV
jgi:excisionase family DNA binding protein